MTTHEVDITELNTYPMLEDHISASEVITSQGSEFLIYNTVTGKKIYPNKATFDFLTLATGTDSFEQIIEGLSRQSGEPPEQITLRWHLLSCAPLPRAKRLGSKPGQ